MNQEDNKEIQPTHIEANGSINENAKKGEANAEQEVLTENQELYLEALEKYGEDGAIEPADEKRLKRKLDMRILPLLGICYFFYYIDKTTLSYAAIFGIRTDLDLSGGEYSWLSSIFYFGWLGWAIPSNLIMQHCPPAYYLAGNIFMWGALLMAQAGSHNFATLAALRVLSGAFEAIADPAFMLFTSMFYTRAEQPSRISAWYAFNGIGVAGGGLIGYGIGQIKASLAPWRYEFIIVGAFCAAWGICLFVFLPNSPTTFRGFSHDEKLMMIARLRKNQTGVEHRRINWTQIKEAFTDYKTYMFTFLGFIGNIPNGGLSNFSTLVIKGLGFNTLNTALLGIPQGVLVCIWIGLGAIINERLPKNSRTIVCAMFMIPTIAGALGFLLAPEKAYVGRLICFYLTGSYQSSFVLSLSLITSNTGGQSKKMIVSGMIWFGACIGNIAGPFFYKSNQAPSYHLGIGSILVCNCLELALFFAFRFAFIWENKKKERQRAQLGDVTEEALNRTAFADLTDKQNPNFTYVY
ncbi:major facilitator superfamily domain-containing protein [Naematelia encephala]|uniref:Major facilitator superfamily domain-containing protein n=1 Tax=Naematelia encephala TaxID=71784 RepID=A0A1Y2AZN0_9TREE|nr:major facilitator superfamily domain-containing protein [Naematelia encephala]